MVSFSKLLSFATTKDKVYLAIGLIASAGNGIIMPFFALIFGEMTDAFSPLSNADDVIRSAGK